MVRPRRDGSQLDRRLLERHGEGSLDEALCQLMEVRRTAEPQAAALATRRAQPGELGRIEDAYAGMEAAGSGVEAFSAAAQDGNDDITIAMLDMRGSDYIDQFIR